MKNLTHKLEEIKEHFQEIEDIMGTLTPQEHESILNAHHEHATIQYCLRWGSLATEEILRLIEAGEFEVEEC